MIIFGYYVVCLNMLVCIIELGEVVESCIEVFLCPCEVSWVEVTRRNLIGSMIKMQVSQPFVMQESYLRSAEQRYRGFLYLFTLNKGLFLVPTYDVDIMWWAIITNFAISTNSTFVWRMLFPHLWFVFYFSLDFDCFLLTALIWRSLFTRPWRPLTIEIQNLTLHSTLELKGQGTKEVCKDGNVHGFLQGMQQIMFHGSPDFASIPPQFWSVI